MKQMQTEFVKEISKLSKENPKEGNTQICIQSRDLIMTHDL